MRIIGRLLESDGSDLDVEGLLNGSMVKKADDLRLATSRMVTDEQRNKMNVNLSQYRGVKECKA